MIQPKYKPALVNLALRHQGKTRDTFELSNDPKTNEASDLMLIYATDRLSTHNIVHSSTVPDKGAVLTAITIFWLKKIVENVGIRHHLVAYGKDIYRFLPGKPSDYPADLYRRAIIVRKLKPIPIEFIFRSYLAGSLFDKFYAKGLPDPYGLNLPRGLHLMEPFNEPVFTPTDKSETDDPLKASDVRRDYLEAWMLTDMVNKLCRSYLRSRGYELVDTKLEVARDADGYAVLIDEVVTPDSSRYCDLKDIDIGKMPSWADKQVARDYAEKTWGNGEKVPLEFPPELIEKMTATYRTMVSVITGSSLEDFWKQRLG